MLQLFVTDLAALAWPLAVDGVSAELPSAAAAMADNATLSNGIPFIPTAACERRAGREKPNRSAHMNPPLGRHCCRTRCCAASREDSNSRRLMHGSGHPVTWRLHAA
jgi:hypothetical protein